MAENNIPDANNDAATNDITPTHPDTETESIPPVHTPEEDTMQTVSEDMSEPPAVPEELPMVSVLPENQSLTYPLSPSSQYFGQVRFLNASANSFPVTISVDQIHYAINSRFGTISDYDWISDGFHTITVRRAVGLRTILLQQTFPFVSGEKVTMVLTDSGSGSLNMVRVSDMGCANIPYGTGCYRMANMTCHGSSYDLMLYSGETVFRNVGFQQVTPYKQAMAGSYQFYITNSASFSVIREMPVIVIGISPIHGTASQPLASIQVDIDAGRNYTSYLIGNTWSNHSFRVMTVED